MTYVPTLESSDMGMHVARSFAHNFISLECLVFTIEVQEHRAPTLDWDN
jgi:hypothetical protein